MAEPLRKSPFSSGGHDTSCLASLCSCLGRHRNGSLTNFAAQLHRCTWIASPLAQSSSCSPSTHPLPWHRTSDATAAAAARRYPRVLGYDPTPVGTVHGDRPLPVRRSVVASPRVARCRWTAWPAPTAAAGVRPLVQVFGDALSSALLLEPTTPWAMRSCMKPPAQHPAHGMIGLLANEPSIVVMCADGSDTTMERTEETGSSKQHRPAQSHHQCLLNLTA